MSYHTVVENQGVGRKRSLPHKLHVIRDGKRMRVASVLQSCRANTEMAHHSLTFVKIMLFVRLPKLFPTHEPLLYVPAAVLYAKPREPTSITVRQPTFVQRLLVEIRHSEWFVGNDTHWLLSFL
jgi:hypothetical protein